MTRASVSIEDCTHLWWLVLRVDRTIALICEACRASDSQVFKGGVLQSLDIELGGARVRGGHHDYDGSEAWVPVNLYVSQSMAYDVQHRSFDQRTDVVVTPREVPTDPNVIDGTFVEEVEANTAALLDAIDRQDQSTVETETRGTGWCSPSP